LKKKLLGSSSFLKGKGSETEVWLYDAEVREECLSLFVRYLWVDDNIIAWNPIDWGGDTVFVTSLERVDDSQNLSRVPSSRSWVRQDETYDLLWVNNKHRSNGEGNSLGVHIGGVLVIQHVVEISNLSVLVTDDWESQGGTRHLIDVIDPAIVGLNCVCRQANELDISLVEFWLKFCKGTKLSCANWSIILRMGEKNAPAVTDKIVKVDGTRSSHGIEIWSNTSETKGGSTFHCIVL